MSHVTYKNPPNTAPAQGLYSHAATANGGEIVYIAGQLAVGKNGEVVGKNNFEKQFDAVFQNLEDVLKGLGGDFSSVVKFTTYLVRSQDIDTFMSSRAELFPKLFPARVFPPNTLLIVDRLVKEDFLIEVEAIAAV